MSDEKLDDLAARVFKFLKELPTTICSDVLVFVVSYTVGVKADFDFGANTDFVSLMREYLLESRSGMARVGGTICAIGVVDYVLARSAAKSRESKRTLEQLSQLSPKLKEHAKAMSLSVPLRQKHFDQALVEWKQMRATVLSEGALKQYEDYCLSHHAVIKEELDW